MTSKPRYHTYWNSLITLSLTLMQAANLSFSGTAHALEVFREQDKIPRAPSVETCLQWEMKLGLHKLTRPKKAADDWVWIADHVVNKGAHKCLAVLGVRMTPLIERGDLTVRLKDVEPLGIVPMKVSTGTLMEAEFEEILEKNHGIPPLAIVKDNGSDLRCGGRNFCETHPGVIDILDVPHKIACLYKQQLRDDEMWGKFTTQCSDFKKQVQLTSHANISPPNQRSKARYHNIDVLVDWGIGKLLGYGKLAKESQEKLKWLKEYEMELGEWKQLVDVGRIARNFVRKNGLFLDCHVQLMDQLVEMNLCLDAERFTHDLIDFIEEQENKIPEQKTVIGSSEVIESLFGKHKTITEKGPKPMGRLILSMASRVGEPPTEELVGTAFQQVKERDIKNWLAKAFR